MGEGKLFVLFWDVVGFSEISGKSNGGEHQKKSPRKGGGGIQKKGGGERQGRARRVNVRNISLVRNRKKRVIEEDLAKEDTKEEKVD